MPLRSVVVLAPGDGANEVSLQRLDPAEAAIEVARHTVAVTLFDRDLHARHLLFVAALVGQVGVYRLRYAHDFNCLPQVFDVLGKAL